MSKDILVCFLRSAPIYSITLSIPFPTMEGTEMQQGPSESYSGEMRSSLNIKKANSNSTCFSNRKIFFGFICSFPDTHTVCKMFSTMTCLSRDSFSFCSSYTTYHILIYLITNSEDSQDYYGKIKANNSNVHVK